MGAPPDLDVLALLDEEINVNARRLFGRPVLVFKERAVDPASEAGRAIFFSWWLERAEEAIEPATVTLDSAAPVVDIHDEGETLLVVIGVPGGDGRQAQGRGLFLRAEG